MLVRCLFLIMAALLGCWPLIALGQTEAEERNSEDKQTFFENKIRLQAYGRYGAMRVYHGDPTFSSTCELYALLDDPKACAELEMIDSQLRDLKTVLDDYRPNRKLLLRKLLALQKATDEKPVLQKELTLWQEDESEKYDDRFQQLLIPAQRKQLQRVFLNYHLAGVGLGPTIQKAIEMELVDEKAATYIPQMQNRLNSVAKELSKKCKDFVDSENKRVQQILDEDQWQEIQSEVQTALENPFPELLVSQVEDACEDGTEFEDVNEVWGLILHWELQPSGVFKNRSIRAEFLTYPYLMGELCGPPDLQDYFEFTNRQKTELNELMSDIAKLSSRLSQEATKEEDGTFVQNDNYRSIIEEIRFLAEESLGEILLPNQKDKLDQLAIRMSVERLGLCNSLLHGQLGSQIEITEDQKDSILKEYQNIRGRYQDFNQQTVKWLWNEILQAVDDRKTKQQLQNVFALEFRKVAFPVGCFSTSLFKSPSLRRVN